MTNLKNVYIVHCVDTEGPLYESPVVPFNQIKKVFGIDIEPTHENLIKLVNNDLDLDGKEEAVHNLIDPHKAAINGSWPELLSYLDKITSDDFRNQLTDSAGNGWIFNWFCLDHVGFTGENPRRRDPGHHKVFDKYLKMTIEQGKGDIIQLHHHPISHSGNYHECGTAFWGRSTLNDILCRKIIDRGWFPCAYRPGFHTERPDSNWFLEQWIPFDYANQSVMFNDTDQPDLADGRFGDWRYAPLEWQPYHPDHDDYQKKGNCRRWITRCLNMYARLREITCADVDAAFDLADRTGDAILAFTDHDFKDMAFDIDRIREFIKSSSNKYPDVQFYFVDAVTAMRECCHLVYEELDIKCEIVLSNNKTQLCVWSNSKIFGPQPYLAIKTIGGVYIWDNFDFQNDNKWTYTFDCDSIRFDEVEKIGVAANNAYGKTQVRVYDKQHDKWNISRWN